MTAELVALQALYQEADQALSGWSCEGSTDCCHFDRTGREPYLWPSEWALLEKAIATRGTRKGALAVVREERACPLLGPDHRCVAYAARPFGCRTFYCDRASGPERRLPRAALAEVGKRVAALAKAHHPECDGPRPLTRLLGARR